MDSNEHLIFSIFVPNGEQGYAKGDHSSKRNNVLLIIFDSVTLSEVCITLSLSELFFCNSSQVKLFPVSALCGGMLFKGVVSVRG